MMGLISYLVFFFILALIFSSQRTAGFTTQAFCAQPKTSTGRFSSDESIPESENMPLPDERSATPPPPPPVPKKRLDLLMASLTRMDEATANAPTTSVPFLGEIPADGSLVVLLPAAGIAVLGFIFSIVVAANSGDQLVEALNGAGQDLADKVAAQPNQTYDPSICRGLCAPNDSDIDGLKNLMESFRRD